jgi:transcriptional regulator with XRE-family HTH domain
MKSSSKKMLATLVKESRIARGFTQKDLSELTNISTRSIQRIENGEITPRIYTIKTLAKALDFSLEELEDMVLNEGNGKALNTIQKIILSVGTSFFVLFLAWAYVSQSSSFPETTFEAFLFSGIIVLILTGVLAVIWRTRKK